MRTVRQGTRTKNWNKKSDKNRFVEILEKHEFKSEDETTSNALSGTFWSIRILMRMKNETLLLKNVFIGRKLSNETFIIQIRPIVAENAEHDYRKNQLQQQLLKFLDIRNCVAGIRWKRKNESSLAFYSFRLNFW